MHVRVLKVCDRVKDPLGVYKADFNCLCQVGEVLGEGMGGKSKVKGYGGAILRAWRV